MVYGHYDVQPPDPIEAWRSPPFAPTVRDGNLYARGATDDKGQVFAIIKAFETVTASGVPPVNVRFLIEGQEESGSQVLFDLLNERPDLIRADAALISDAPYYAEGCPAVEVGVRGICYAEIGVKTLQNDLHSGLYGGVAPNALDTLVRILVALKTPAGRIRIPGLYQVIRRPSPREREGWSRLPFNQTSFMRREMGAKAITGQSRYSVLERLWAQPTFEVHGIQGGFVGDGAKTVIPAEARAKISLRLVPDQRAAVVFGQLKRAVEALAPPYAELDFRLISEADPVVVNTDHEAFAQLDRAFREVEGRGVEFTRSGGSLPIVSLLGQGGAAVVMTGIGLPDDCPHAPNEKLSIAQLTKGVEVFTRFFELMGSDGPPAQRGSRQTRNRYERSRNK
jgi:acetylornithine deacetylase/succinyl-diaminopimelate desuccinylase-like protein